MSYKIRYPKGFKMLVYHKNRHVFQLDANTYSTHVLLTVSYRHYKYNINITIQKYVYI